MVKYYCCQDILVSAQNFRLFQRFRIGFRVKVRLRIGVMVRHFVVMVRVRGKG